MKQRYRVTPEHTIFHEGCWHEAGAEVVMDSALAETLTPGILEAVDIVLPLETSKDKSKKKSHTEKE